ncbi:hypothetical protein MKX08_010715 [Trichoderma sp. CBMAI-0020]|nr:hypothetical protein MKX08_010715 [Trichoderma sp. CBMAI-0020]
MDDVVNKAITQAFTDANTTTVTDALDDIKEKLTHPRQRLTSSRNANTAEHLSPRTKAKTTHKRNAKTTRRKYEITRGVITTSSDPEYHMVTKRSLKRNARVVDSIVLLTGFVKAKVEMLPATYM